MLHSKKGKTDNDWTVMKTKENCVERQMKMMKSATIMLTIVIIIQGVREKEKQEYLTERKKKKNLTNNKKKWIFLINIWKINEVWRANILGKIFFISLSVLSYIFLLVFLLVL